MKQKNEGIVRLHPTLVFHMSMRRAQIHLISYLGRFRNVIDCIVLEDATKEKVIVDLKRLSMN